MSTTRIDPHPTLQSPAPQLTGGLFCLFAAIAWGTTGTAATFAPEVPAVAIGAAAMGIGGLLQALLALPDFGPQRHALARALLPLISGAIAVAIYPLAFYASMRLAGVTIGTVISLGSAPILSALLENRLEGKPLTVRWALGATLGLAGMAVLSIAQHGLAPDRAPLQDNAQILFGALLGLLAGGAYAFYSWTLRQMMDRAIPARAAMGATFGLGALFLMPVLLAYGAPFLASPGNFAVGAYMALVPMFLGYLAFGRGLARISASSATTITLFEPVVAALLAMLVVGERLSPLGWSGVALVIACLIWTVAPWPRPRQR